MGYGILGGAGMSGVDCDNATATKDKVLTGKTFGGSGSDDLQTGTMKNATTAHTLTLNEKWTIPAGYHDGTKSVTQNLTYIGAQNNTLSINGSVDIKPGYHNGSGKITQSISTVAAKSYTPKTTDQTVATKGKYLSGNITVPASSTLLASNIVSGKSIFGVSGSFSNHAATHVAYDGSKFYGALNGGILSGSSSSDSTYRYYLSEGAYSGNTDPANFSTASPITATWDITSEISAGYARRSSYGFVSGKSINFSLYSKVTLNITYTMHNHSTVPDVFCMFHPITIEKTSSSNKYRTSGATYDSALETKTVVTHLDTSTVTADVTFDVSALKESYFMGINFGYSANYKTVNNTYTIKINKITFTV